MERLAIAIWLVLATGLLADGKMFGREEVPPGIPYQRALILFSKGVETLILQSKYETPGSEGEPEICWVVPLPAPPQVASAPPLYAESLFDALDDSSPPRVTVVRYRLMRFARFLLLASGAAFVILLLASVCTGKPQWLRRRWRLWTAYAILVETVGGGALWLAAGSSLAGGRRVETVSAHRVGIYDVQVIRSDSSEELISWLNGNGFAFGEKDKAAFESHVSRGWCFVVATIRPDVKKRSEKVGWSGLAAPLILRFPHETPIYPLALTGTGGYDTEVLIYLATRCKMSCNDRLKLRYAGQFRRWPLRLLLWHYYQPDPPNFFAFERTCIDRPDWAPDSFADEEFPSPEMMGYPYLCKFKDTLTPEEMAEDLVFTPAPDNTPYREHQIHW
jgi:hypothetical protein